MQEEELSVSEILSSIRQVLAKETDALNAEISKDNVGFTKTNKPQVMKPIIPAKREEVVLELTPQMRISNEQIFTTDNQFKVQKSQFLEQVEATDKTEAYIKAWLAENLPSVVEKIVTQEVRRLINKKN